MLLEQQDDTWLLKDSAGDAMAYFHLNISDCITELPNIGVDISGRHYNCDKEVLFILRKLQGELGGEITFAP